MKKNSSLYKLLGKPIHPYEKFQQITKIKKLDQVSLNPSDWPKEWNTVYFKEYPRLDKIILPEPQTLAKFSLEKTLRDRKSSRDFISNPLSLEELSALIYYSAGLKNDSPPHQGNRFYPSAGSRYPLELYLISQNSELPNGIYHYNIRSHSLEVMDSLKNYNPKLYFNQDFVSKAGVIFLVSAVFIRNTMKYGSRGYRHILMEAGHMAQNFWLVSSALDLGICGVGGFVDDKLNNLLDLDGLQESLVNVFVIGKI